MRRLLLLIFTLQLLSCKTTHAVSNCYSWDGNGGESIFLILNENDFQLSVKGGLLNDNFNGQWSRSKNKIVLSPFSVKTIHKSSSNLEDGLKVNFFDNLSRDTLKHVMLVSSQNDTFLLEDRYDGRLYPSLKFEFVGYPNRKITFRDAGEYDVYVSPLIMGSDSIVLKTSKKGIEYGKNTLLIPCTSSPAQ